MSIKDAASRKAYHKEYHKQWYQKNKVKRLKQVQEYEDAQPEGWRKKKNRNYHLKKRYNLTQQEYDTKLASQENKCAICGRDAKDNIRSGEPHPLHIDHCHITNKIRDLLCHSCNTGLGQFKDNIESLQKAIDYLRKHML